jgi:diguanylate cyclase (GGDEF)-like protein/PAS domain S-box-containing protein
MPADAAKLPRTVTAIAAIVAAIVALAGPLGYFELRYERLTAEMLTEIDIKAQDTSQLIASTAEMWVYQKYRLAEVLRRRPQLTEQATRIFDHQGNLILGLGERPVAPMVCRAAPLYDSGVATGNVEVCRSLRELAWETAGVALISLILAAVIFLTLRTVPLRALRRAMRSLAREKERAEVTLHSIGDAVVTADREGRVEYLNPIAERITGWRSDEAVGRSVSEILRFVNELTNQPVPNPLNAALMEKRITPLAQNAGILRRDGQFVAIEDSAAPILDKGGEVIGGVLVFHDISAARHMAQRLSWQAAHDTLTGLVNRKEFDHLLAEALHSARTQGKDHALCYIDLDHFELIKETCGHIAGDELLKQVSSLLQARARGSDTLARLGGDEFGMLLESCPLDKARTIATDTIEAIKGLRFTWQDRVFALGASIGIVAVTPHSTSTHWLVGAADTACSSARESGRNRVHVFEQGDEELAARRDQMCSASAITRALEKGRFVLYGQSYQALSSAPPQPRHLELLLRMVGDKGEIILPDAFIAAAERYDLMTAIDKWVITQVFNARPALAQKLGPDLICAINLSVTALADEHLVDFILARAQATNAQRGGFCFEIAEASAVNRMPKVVPLMRQLRNAGFKFALDNFGAGMSSFSYLKNLPVDYLKIDGSLIKSIPSDKVSRKTVAAINDIGHAMGVRTVAQHIENPDVLKAAREMGVDFAQGYLIDEPMPLAELSSRDLRAAAR